MAQDTCKHCGARFPGEGAAAALGEHVESFHPAGSPAPISPASTGTAKGPNLGPAVADLGAKLQALTERVGTLEAAIAPEPEAKPSFADIKARAIELGLPAVGVTRTDLEAAIAAAEAGTKPDA